MLAGAAFIPSCVAHETRPAYLEIKETSPDHYDVVWRTPGERGYASADLLQLPADAKNVTAPTTQELTDSLARTAFDCGSRRGWLESASTLLASGHHYGCFGACATPGRPKVGRPSCGRRSRGSRSLLRRVDWVLLAPIMVQGIRHILFGPGSFVLRAGVAADREGSLDAAEDDHGVHGGAQHHAWR